MGCFPEKLVLVLDLFQLLKFLLLTVGYNPAKENRALCSTFGYFAIKIMHTKVCLFLKPHNQRDEEEAGHYGSAEDAGLMYSHNCRNHSPQMGKEHVLFSRYWVSS